jgi:hypothetical protein
MPLLLSVNFNPDGCLPLLALVCEISSSLEAERLSTKYPAISSSVFKAPAPLNTIADVYSGVRAPEADLKSTYLRLVAKPYIDTERRSEGRRGSRNWTADGSIEYSIEASFVRGAKSVESGRSRIAAGWYGWPICAMLRMILAHRFLD